MKGERSRDAESALKIRHRQFVIDGEAVVLGVDGVADFNALHSRKHDHEVQLYAFDIMALDGEDDPRALPCPCARATGFLLGYGGGQYSTVEYRVQHAGAASHATLF